MALSPELRQKLVTLTASIVDFMKLHDNPYDSSAYDALAEKLQQVQQLLAVHVADGVVAVDDPEEEAPTTNSTIQKSVGNKGVNQKNDVQLVQELLNKSGASLTEDGKNGSKTIAAIKTFQRSIGHKNPDGLIEPGRGTWKALIGGKGNAGGQGSVAPGGQRGIKAVATRYGYSSDPYANQNDLNAIGNNANTLVQGKSVALSPELYTLLGIGRKSGDYINVEFPDGSIKKFQTADQTAPGLKGLRVDFFDPKGAFKSVDGKTLYVTKA